MTAERLSEAANLLRNRANRAAPGPWRDTSVGGNRYRALVADAPHPDRENVDAGGWGYEPGYGGCLIGESLMRSDRVYIASMDPGVGAILAGWLGHCAQYDTANGWANSIADRILAVQS